MKNLLLTIFALLQINSTFAQWDVKYVEDVNTSSLFAIKLYNEDVGFAMGTNGKILKTTDQGENWDEIESDIIGAIIDFDFLSLDTIITVSSHFDGDEFEGKIHKSIDGGLNWTEKYTREGGFACIQFINSQIGIASGFGHILKSYDAGESWEIVFDIALNGFEWGSVRKFEMIDDSIGYAIGIGKFPSPVNTLNSILFKTLDGGNTWQAIDQFDSWFEELKFINVNEGFVSNPEYMLKTTDGGMSWDTLNNVPGVVGISIPSINKMVTVNRPAAYLTSAPFTYFAISKSLDAGGSWDGELSKGIHLEDVFFLTDSIGFVAGDYSLIMKTENCGGEITGDYPWDLFTATNELEIKVLELYPNPSKETLFIDELDNGDWKYLIQTIGGLTISQGKMINKEIDISNISQGLYILVLENETEKRIGRFMKM